VSITHYIRRGLLFTFSIPAALLCGGVAEAYSECAVTLTSVFAGDEGAFYVGYSNGGSSVILVTDPDFNQTVALITTAMVADKQVEVRYAADGVSCTATYQPIVGIHFYK